jgi:hypothetical protein
MSRRRNRLGPLGLALASLLVSVATVTVAGTQAAQAAVEFPQCPAIGFDTGCGALITINADGTSTVQFDASQPPYSGVADTLVGVVNDSGAPVSGLALSGTLLNQGIFAFDGHGLCVPVSGTGSSPPPAGCPFDAGPTGYQPTGYEGPGTWFSVTGPTAGVVQFASNLAPQGNVYFSLHGIVDAASVAELAVAPVPVPTAVPVSAQATVPFAGPVATFTDADPSVTTGNVTAAVDWGDGSPLDTATTITETSGVFSVGATHTYAATGPFPVTVSITDPHGVTVLASSTAAVANAPVTCQPGVDCTGTTSQGGQTVVVNGESKTQGTFDVSIGSTSITCNDNKRHAPFMTTIVESGLSGRGFTVVISFPQSQAVGPPTARFAVCFSSTVPFKDAQGQLVTTGDLARCDSTPRVRRPCQAFKVQIAGTAFEKILIPAQDPRFW